MKVIRSLIPSIYNQIINLHNAGKFPISIPEITVNEEQYLDILYNLGNPTFTEFAAKAQITRPAATQIVQKLSKKGYVEKKQSKKDGRVYHLNINPTIKKHFEESDLYLDEIYADCLGVLSEAEKSQLKQILSKINQSLHKVTSNEMKI